MKTKPSPGKWLCGFCAAATLLLCGCFDTQQEFIINPDGSGKVIHESRYVVFDPAAPNAAPEEALRNATRNILQKTAGVDAWRDVSFKLLDDGRFYFKGTAYFKDLGRLDFTQGQSALKFAWHREGGGKAALLPRRPAAGNRTDNDEKDWANLSAEERAAKIQEAQVKCRQVWPLLAAVMGSMKMDVSFRLPGTPTETALFEQEASGALRGRLDGAKLVQLMEQRLNDPEWIAKSFGKKNRSEALYGTGDEFQPLLFGMNGDFRAAVSRAETPLFDYAAELAEAQKSFAAIRKELGVTAAYIAPPTGGLPLKNMKVVGMRYVRPINNDLGLRSFNGSGWPFFHIPAGCTLSLFGELPGSVLSVGRNNMVETALADDGSSLLPDNSGGRILSPRLSHDKTAVMFEVDLKPPGPGVRSLKKLSGTLQCDVAVGSREVDLGFGELKTDACGTELGARIKSISPSGSGNGSRHLDLKLDIGADNLKTVWLSVDGARTVLERRGCFSGGGTTFMLSSQQPIPVQGRLVVEIFDKVQTFDSPFHLENIPLLAWPAE